MSAGDISARLAADGLRAVVATGHDGAALLIVERLRETAVENRFVLLIIEQSVGSLDRAMLLAAIGPLAVELAPGTRLSAIDILVGTNDADVAAAGRFLAAATSTTGQTLTIGPL